MTENAQIIQAAAAECGDALMDINTLTADHPEWFATDGVRPHNDGAAAIAEAVYQASKGAENE